MRGETFPANTNFMWFHDLPQFVPRPDSETVVVLLSQYWRRQHNVIVFLIIPHPQMESSTCQKNFSGNSFKLQLTHSPQLMSFSLASGSRLAISPIPPKKHPLFSTSKKQRGCFLVPLRFLAENFENKGDLFSRRGAYSVEYAWCLLW